MWHYVVTSIMMSIGFMIILNNTKFNTTSSSNISQFFNENRLQNQDKISIDNNVLSESQIDKRRILDDKIKQADYFDSIFQGDWNGAPGFTGEQFNFFGGDHGIILFGLSYNEFNYDEIDFLLLDPRYDDEKKIYIQLQNVNNCLVNSSTWTCTTTILTKSYYKRTRQNTNNIKVDFYMEVKKQDEKEELSQSNSIFDIKMVSSAGENIQVNLTATLTVQDGDFTVSFLLYNLFITLFGLQQLYSVNALTNYIQNTNEIISTKLSMLTIGFVTVFDSYVSLAHLYMALEYTNYFYYFILPTLIYFVMTTIVDMKLLILVWKNRCYIHFTSPQEIRKGFALFYAKFYISLILFFVLTYFFYLYNEFLLIWPIFIVPQIVHNFMKGNSPLFLNNYVFGMILSRAIIPFYYRTCPDNIRNLAPSLYFSITWPILFIFFISVLYLQYKIGPRFFVPRRFKGGYDYYKSFYTNDPVMDEDCPICMSKLKDEPEDENDPEDEQRNSGSSSSEMEGIQQQQQQNIINQEKLVKKKKIAVTPCNHKYHVSCFKSWINIKLECPSCRNQLKPLID